MKLGYLGSGAALWLYGLVVSGTAIISETYDMLACMYDRQRPWFLVPAAGYLLGMIVVEVVQAYLRKRPARTVTG